MKIKIIIGIVCASMFLFGADYGKIAGKVIDAETGEPLIGADVIVEGSELGAATDEIGEYTVLYVPVGTYRIVASYISY
ncbi:MAG: carboxypeptidase-like regulatory domain-containing protein, partial [bacterium]